MTITRNTDVPGAGQPAASGDQPVARKTGMSALKPEDFVTLMLQQLKHQNPMNPTDSNSMLQQMSQISQMSASTDMQQTMRNMQQTMLGVSQSVNSTLGNSQVLEATQLIGKNVVLESGVSPLVKDPTSGASVMAGSVMVPAASSKVSVTVMDSSGNTVKTIDLGSAGQAGLMDFTWDGMDADGKVLPPDYYHISATANVDGSEVPARTAGSFKVNSVALDQSGVILNVDGLGGKSMGDLIKIL